MIRDLQGKICFITGAASGIGKATALRCAREGARLILTDINQKGLETCAEEATIEGGEIIASKALDISDADAVSTWAEELHQQIEAVDIVMNIAGISTWGSMKTLKNHHWRSLIEINLMGPIAVLEAFVPKMMDTDKPGHIVNVSSAAGLFGLPWHAAYSATKFGLRGISEVLRFDLEHYDIGVSLVCPGAVDTGLVKTVNIVGIDREDKAVQQLVQRFQHRAVSPEKAAKSIVRGIKKNQYIVHTSLDIRVGHWFKRCFEFPYRMVMRFMNRKVQKLAEKNGVD